MRINKKNLENAFILVFKGKIMINAYFQKNGNFLKFINKKMIKIY